MRAAHVVGAWAAGNLVLAMLLLAFDPPAGPVVLYVGAVALVAGFGVVVLLASRAGLDGAQRRQPRRASAAVFAAIGVAVGLTGFAYSWWLWAAAVYPLALAAWLLRGERLRSGAHPWPAALDGTEPAHFPRSVHRGSPIGVATRIPAEHEPRSWPPRPSPRMRSAALVFVGARTIVDLLRRRRR